MKIWNPAVFQGSLRKTKYFEGWYFKVTNKNMDRTIAFIPGISITKNDRHSFIQVMDSINYKSVYIRYPLESFTYNKDDMFINIDGNMFTKELIILDIYNKEAKIKGDIAFLNSTPWPVKLFSPGAMGWFSFVPFMECYHGIINMNTNINGSLSINGEKTDFTGGKAYIEKDWGSSFPKTWIWFQSNHFDDSDVSITGSIGIIPWFGNSFVGFICGIRFKNKLYRFTTYTRAKISKLSINEENVEIELKDRNNKICFNIKCIGTGALVSPIKGEMGGKIKESLTSEIQVKLYEKEQLIFEGLGKIGGLEISGDISLLPII